MVVDFLKGVRTETRLDNLHKYCIDKAVPDGLFLEFGVCEGTTLTMLRSIIPTEQTIYGFDSFEGLPEDWNGHPAGTFKTKTRVELEHVVLIEGWFEDTVPAFARDHYSEHASYIHIDCDLYSSTKTVLEGLDKLIVPGTVVVFDELVDYEGWEEHEYRALIEFCLDTGRTFEYLARHSYFRVGIRFT